MANADEIGAVEVQSFIRRDFRLLSGEVVPELKLVYETYGRLASNGNNAILLCHGFASSQHAAGTDAAGEPGWWNALAGPGRAIDTDKYFVVSSNMLGSSFGSSAPGQHQS
ncbi:MAG: hypothetical protein ACREQR_03805 [Candidatus Binataceae bacterium]